MVYVTDENKILLQGHSSKGNQNKFVLENTWYKTDDLGYEGFAETIASNLLPHTNIDNYVKYDEEQIRYKNTTLLGSKSIDFKPLGSEIVTAATLFKSNYNKSVSDVVLENTVEDTIYHFVNECSKLTGIPEDKMGDYIEKMVEFDALILNDDRHYNNIPFVFNDGIFSIGPIFDNGAGFLSDTLYHPIINNTKDELETYIAQLKSRPFSQDFNEQLTAARSLFGRRFEIDATINDVIPNTSLYNNDVLVRCQTILELQFDKYPEMFKKPERIQINQMERKNTHHELHDSQMLQTLKKLDAKLTEKGCKPIELNVVGGFALILQGVRKDPDAMTDIDYVGDALPEDMEQIVDDFGVNNNLGTGWINNNILLLNSSLEDLEFSTGSLHFEKALELNTITINALKKEDLLRMKVIAIDTNVMAKSFGGDFTRFKDFQDIKDLMNHLGYTMLDLEMETYQYVEEQDKTYGLIETFLEKGAKETQKQINDLAH